VNNRVDGGEAPDVARWPARWIPQLVGKDELEPIDELMESDFGDRFYQGMAEGCMYQGSIMEPPGLRRTSASTTIRTYLKRPDWIPKIHNWTPGTT